MAGAARQGGRGREAGGKAAAEAAEAVQGPPESPETPPASVAPPVETVSEIQPTMEEAAALATLLLPGFGAPLAFEPKPERVEPVGVPMQIVITAVAQAPLLARIAAAVGAATQAGRSDDAHALHAVEVRLTAALTALAPARDAAGPDLGADLERLRALLT